MNEEKKKKENKPIGGIQAQRWNHFGSEEEDSQLSEKPDSQKLEYQKSPKAQLPDSLIAEEQDIRMVSYPREKKPERKAQIAYLPPGLIKRLKRFAVDRDLEISMVVQVAVQEYLEKQENRQV